MKRIMLFNLLLLVACYVTAQTNVPDNIINVVARNEIDNTIKTASFNQGSSYKLGMGVELLGKYLHVNDATNELRLANTTQTKNNITVEKYQQYYKGLKVEKHVFSVMYGRDSMVTFMNGDYSKISEDVNVTPSITDSEALHIALVNVPAELYAWQSTSFESMLKEQKKDSSATYYPKGELVLIEDKRLSVSDGKLHLAYKYEIYTLSPLNRQAIYIDAIDGSLLHSAALMQSATGSGNSLYSGFVTFETEPISGSIYLNDITRGSGIATYRATSAGSSLLVSSSTSFFSTSPAIDAHWAAEKIYDYWLTEHSRNSYDNTGGIIRSIVNYNYGLMANNAMWDGVNMYYSDGNGISTGPYTTLDICAHELGHGVCQYTANLDYEKEPGAMNEGFSDIWAAVIETWADPHETDARSKDHWYIMEEINATPVLWAGRSMSIPNDKGQPDTYKGIGWSSVSGCVPSTSNDRCGVHTNSGVLNYWFYLLANGGSGYNDFSQAYSVTGIGITDAASIAYNTELILVHNNKFIDCYYASIAAATAIFGPCSSQVTSVINAWQAVGIGNFSAIYGVASVCAGHTTSLSCAVGGGTWSSSNPSVATIASTGIVTAISAGTTTISYTVGSSCGYAIVVTVNSSTGAPSLLGPTSGCMWHQIAISAIPWVGFSGLWTTNNPDLADFFMPGVLVGTGAGTVIVSYSLGVGCSAATMPFTVLQGPSSISIYGGSQPLCSDRGYNFYAEPTTGTWTSSTAAVAFTSLIWGRGTTLAAGTAMITYTLSNGCHVEGSVSVVNNTAAIAPVSTNLCTGATRTLTGIPSGGVWASSTPAVATIGSTSGIVTGISSGTAIFTYWATAGDHCFQTVQFDILPQPIITSPPPSICVAEAVTLASSVPSYSTWSGGGAVAAVSTGGIVTGLAAGTTTITCSIAGICNATVICTVNPSPGPITGGDLGVCTGSTITLGNSVSSGTWSCYPGTGSATIAPVTGILTGVSAGTVTVDYTISSGCSRSLTVNVVAPPGTITGTLAICLGGLSTLSNPTPGGLWTSATPTVATISSSGIVHGLTVGTSIISYTLPAGCYITTVLTVNPLPAPITGPSTVCMGNTITLSCATPGGTWTSGASSIASVDIGTGVVTPVSVGFTHITYTITSTGCYAVSGYIYVNNAVLPITGPYNSVCDGSSGITLSDASLGGTWSSSSPTIATVGSSSGVVLATPPGAYTSGTQVTITYTTLGPGCTKTYPVNVYFDNGTCSPCNYNKFSTTNDFNTLSGPIYDPAMTGNFYLSGDVDIAANTVAQDAMFFVASGKKISVEPNSSFTSNGSHLFSCPASMWKGIELKSSTSTPVTTAHIILQGSTPSDPTSPSTLIEDAETAVLVNSPGIPNSGGSYFVESYNTIFNCNSVGISINNFIPSVPSVSVTPVKIKNTTFTGKTLTYFPFTWPGNYGTGGLKNTIPVATNYQSPYNINTYTNANCHNGQVPVAGISFNNVGATTGTTYAGVQIGEPATPPILFPAFAPEWNLFDALVYGINATNTNLTCQNNVFQNSRSQYTSTVPAPFFGAVPEQVGIYTNMNDAKKYQLNVVPATSGYGWSYTVAKNMFYDCRIGVYSKDYNILNCQQSEMRSTQVSISGDYGRYGYMLQSASYENVKVNDNAIYNLANGVSFVSSYFGGYSVPVGGGLWVYVMPSQNLGNIEINGNRIQAALGAITPTTQFMSFGIAVQNSLPGGSEDISHPTIVIGSVHTDKNIIKDGYRGILVQGYQLQQAYTGNNTITVRPHNNEKCWGINHTNNFKNVVLSNQVTGVWNGNKDPLIDSVRAYLSEYNSSAWIACNKADNTGRGYEFFSDNAGMRWKNNEIDHHLKGMLLNHSYIGAQGWASNPYDNAWTATSWYDLLANKVQTFVIASPAGSASPLYVQSGWSTEPTVNDGFPLLNAYDPSSTPPGINIASGWGISDCPIQYVDHVAQRAGGYEPNVRSELAYTEFSDARTWIAQFSAWEAVNRDTVLTDSSATLAQFKTMAVGSRLAYLTHIERLLAEGDMASAATEIATTPTPLSPALCVDTTTGVNIKDDSTIDYIIDMHREFYNIYLNYLQYAMDSTDSVRIPYIAQLCPLEYGSVVYKARALYTTVFNDLRVWCEGCDEGQEQQQGQGGGGRPTIKPKTDNRQGQLYTLHPNPNDGNITLVQSIADSATVMVDVMDITGRSVYKEQVQFSNNQYRLNLEQLTPGMYVTNIIDTKGRKFISKFVKQ